jgi:acetyltransferase
VPKLPIRWKTLNGKKLLLRLMRPDDVSGVTDFLNRLSPTARRYRFFSPVSNFSDQMVTKLVVVDQGREYALVAICTEHGNDFPVGGGRFVIDESGCNCEFSVLVADDWQGQGIGRRVLGALIAEAVRRGLGRIVGDVLAENGAMIALGRAMGFAVTESDEGYSVIRLVRELPPPAAGLVDGVTRKLNRLRRRAAGTQKI